MSDEPLIVAPDGLYTPEIKRHSLEKIRLHNRYAAIFATAMRPQWKQLAYIGLYSGAGHANVAGTSDVVETSALSVLRQQVPFTDYIYVDRELSCVEALRTRAEPLRQSANVTILHADVNTSAAAVRAALPRFSKNNGLLSFCFVDPFDLQLQFETIRALGDLRMDFLVLLMLGVDARRNIDQYRRAESPDRIGQLIDCPDWRTKYPSNRKIVTNLLGEFDQAMQRLKYLSASDDDVHYIKIPGMGVMLYVLAFYSKSRLGKKFWRETRSSLNPQLGLNL